MHEWKILKSGNWRICNYRAPIMLQLSGSAELLLWYWSILQRSRIQHTWCYTSLLFVSIISQFNIAFWFEMTKRVIWKKQQQKNIHIKMVILCNNNNCSAVQPFRPSIPNCLSVVSACKGDPSNLEYVAKISTASSYANGYCMYSFNIHGLKHHLFCSIFMEKLTYFFLQVEHIQLVFYWSLGVL